jgi:hypothetical protein
MERNEVVETFPTRGSISRSQNAFACGTRAGDFSTRSCIDLKASSTAAENTASAIVHQEPVRFIVGQDAPELLHRPLGRRVLRGIPMQNPTGADL